MSTKKDSVAEYDVRDEITKHLEEIERPLAWLSDKTSIPYATLYSCFKQKLFAINPDNLQKINETLGTTFIS